MELFDVIKKMFDTDAKWAEVPNWDKNRYFFMINRIMSIQFPNIAHQFNHVKISPIPTVDWWHGNLRNVYKKSPQWVFTSVKSIKEKNKKIEINEEVRKLIKERFEVSEREIREAREFWPKEFENFCKSIESQISTVDVKKTDI
jgi:hypothetical protein